LANKCLKCSQHVHVLPDARKLPRNLRKRDAGRETKTITVLEWEGRNAQGSTGLAGMHLQHRKIKEKQNRLAKSTTSKWTLWGKMQKALQNQGEMCQREVYAKLIGAKLLIPGGTTWFTSLDKWGGEKPDANRRLQKRKNARKAQKDEVKNIFSACKLR
jgi:hypothetical protein